MVASEQPAMWLREINAQIENQPNTCWSIGKLKLAIPNLPGFPHAVAIDNVTAYGPCNARVRPAAFSERAGRIEMGASFNEFELRGESHLVGKFQITLQAGKQAQGLFRQRYIDRLWPIFGFWSVPFVIETAIGRLVPRPSDPEAILRSAEPGEFAIPPLGSWFEKGDPINLVLATNPDGPTVAMIEHAAHCLINAGDHPTVPPSYLR
jgi:hypothetical protein